MRMPPPKLKPSEIATEAKRTYIPYITQKLPQYPVRSFLHTDSSDIQISPKKTTSARLRVAVIDGDPVDVALDWFEYEETSKVEKPKGKGPDVAQIPVVNVANEKRAGGDWESGLMAPEENLCRRSNLVHCLTTPWHLGDQNYPIPLNGGVYSPSVGQCAVMCFRFMLILQLSSVPDLMLLTQSGKTSKPFPSFLLPLYDDPSSMRQGIIHSIKRRS